MNSIEELEIWSAGKNLLDRTTFTRRAVTSCSYDADSDTFTYTGAATDNSGAITFDGQVFPPGRYTVKTNGGVIHLLTDVAVGTYNSVYAGFGMPYFSALAGNSKTLNFRTPFRIGFVLVPGSGSFRVTFVHDGESTEFDSTQAHGTTVNLSSNALRSLPDGTCDVLTIGEDGTASIDQKVRAVEYDANDFTIRGAKFCGASLSVAYAGGVDFAQTKQMSDFAPIANADNVVGSPRCAVFTQFMGSIVTELRAGNGSVEENAQAQLDGFKSLLGSKTWRHLYARAEDADISLPAVTLPALPGPTANVWAVATDGHGNTFTLQPEIELEYARDVTLVIGSLEAKVAALELLHETE